MTVKRRHIRTGRPKGPPLGTANNLKHGMRSAAAVERRKAIAWLVRTARALARADL
jgi:hypothetical protein